MRRDWREVHYYGQIDWDDCTMCFHCDCGERVQLDSEGEAKLCKCGKWHRLRVFAEVADA